MPDDPIDNTPNLGLGQWAEGTNPGFAALNQNWELIDEAIGALDLLIASKASQASLDALTEDFNDFVTEINATLAAFIKADGTVAMSANLNLGDNRIVDLANGIDDTDGVNVQQLEGAIAAAVGGIAGAYSYVLARNTGDLTDTSPVLFEADENDDSTTDSSLHDEVTDNSEFVAAQDGFYLFIFRGRIADGGGASCKWLINGIEAPACVFPMILHDVGDNETFLQDVCPMALEAGDVVTLGVYGLVSEPLTIKADSTVAMFLLFANATGGGDLKSDGSIPMVAPFDGGGFKYENLDDGVAASDAATVGQMDAADDALQAQIDLLSAGQTLQAPEVEVTSGAFAFGTAWSEFTASRLDFTLTALTRVVMDAQATGGRDFLQRHDAQIGIRVQLMVAGVPSGAPADYYGTGSHTAVFGDHNDGTVCITKRVTLAAGDWRVSIICRRMTGLANSSGIYASADLPARIGVTYMA